MLLDFSTKLNFDQFDLITRVITIFEKNLQSSVSEINSQLAKLAPKMLMKTPAFVNESEHQHKNLWILKPTGLNRGIGIHVFRSPTELKNILWSHYRIEQFNATTTMPIPPQKLEPQTESECEGAVSIKTTSFII